MNDAANWQGGVLPGTGSAALFNNAWNNASTTFTLDSDMTFKRFVITPPTGTRNNEYIYDLGGNTITLSGSGVNTSSTTIFQSPYPGSMSGATLCIKNGTISGVSTKDPFKYHMSNVIQQNLKIFVDGENTRWLMDAFKFAANNSLFCVTNGAYVQGALIMAQVDNFHNMVQVTGKGSVWNLHEKRTMLIDGTEINGPVRLADIKDGHSSYVNEVVLRVDNGGIITNFYGRVGGSASCAKVEIDNAKLYACSNSTVGMASQSTNNFVRVNNGGELILLPGATLLIGNEGSYNGLIVNGENSTARYPGEFRIGSTSTAKGNYAEVSGGGYLCCTGRENNYIGSSGQSNALRVKGEGSKAEFNYLTYVGSSATATNNCIEVSDGGLLYGKGDTGVFYLNQKKNRFSVFDSGKVDVQQITLGMSAETSCRTNLLEIIGSGSEVKCRNLMSFNGYGNEMTISNGLLKVEGRGIRFNDKDYFDCTVNFAGNTPRIECTNMTNKNTTLVFKVPEGGFADTPVIKTSKDFYLDATCKIVIDADHVAAKKATLIDCANPNIAASVIDNANVVKRGSRASLYSLAKSSDGKKVYLKVSNGTVIVVR